jgi:flagellar hook assembly protein FlgD
VLRVLSGRTTNGSIETFWDGKDSTGIRVKPEGIQIDVETVSTYGERKASKISQRIWAQGAP